MKRTLRILTGLLFLCALAYGMIWLTRYRTMLPGYRSALYTPEAYKKECSSIRKAADTLSVKERSRLLRETVSEKLFPYWEGTRWGFNGTTETPGTGKIACGYFVMTVLRDAGFELERAKLAQLGSEDAIKKIVVKKNITRYSKTPLNDFLAGIRKNGDQLYLVGLDTHIGFLSCEKGKCWFIHSGGGWPASVVKEKAEDCNALAKSNYRVTGCLTTDDSLLMKWGN